MVCSTMVGAVVDCCILPSFQCQKNKNLYFCRKICRSGVPKLASNAECVVGEKYKKFIIFSYIIPSLDCPKTKYSLLSFAMGTRWDKYWSSGIGNKAIFEHNLCIPHLERLLLLGLLWEQLRLLLLMLGLLWLERLLLVPGLLWLERLQMMSLRWEQLLLLCLLWEQLLLLDLLWEQLLLEQLLLLEVAPQPAQQTLLQALLPFLIVFTFTNL